MKSSVLLASSAIGGLASLLLHCTAALAIEEQITVTPYPVQGSTAAAIREDINRQRRAITGADYDAIAQWVIKWEYLYEPTATGCVSTEVTVTHTGKIIMPQIVTPLTATVRQQWLEYHRRLTAHEQQHIQYTREVAQALEAQLTGMTAPTCDQLNAQAIAYGEAAIANAHRLTHAYDQRTNNGETEGVRFP